MEATTQTRRAELEQRIRELAELEERQKAELLELADQVEREATSIHDANVADQHRKRRTREAVLAKRRTHINLLRAQAELLALQIRDLDEQLPEKRALVDRLQEEKRQLDAEISEAQRPVHDLEGRKHRLQVEYYRLVHEAQQFEQGSELL